MMVRQKKRSAMNDLLNRLYLRAPAWSQSAMISAYGALLRRRRYGGRHAEYLAGLLESQWWTAEELETLQLERLNMQLSTARERVPLYRNRRLPDRIRDIRQLGELPFLRKDDLRAPREIVSAGGPGPLLEVHTGGTTGKPLTVYCTRDTLRHNYAFFERLKRWAGVGPRARVATFAGRTVVSAEQRDPPFWRHNVPARTLLCSSYHIARESIPAYASALARFKPDLIDSYPSSIAPIARYVLDHGVDIRPTAVITSSETLTLEVRTLIQEAFGCPVFDHYGAAEMAAFITQCEEGRYHPNPEFGIVEVIKDGVPAGPGEVGEIVATGFINPAMPLIRYQTGDHATAGERGCPCGRAFPAIERIEGRRDDVLITPEGRLVGRLDPIFKAVDSFFETRIIQTSPTHIRVETVPSATYDPADVEVVRTELQRRVGPSMVIEIVTVEELPRTASGKLRAVVNQTAPAHI